MQAVAKENGYLQSPSVPVRIDNDCHAEYNIPPYTSYIDVGTAKPATLVNARV